jgi:hypothetical protein
MQLEIASRIPTNPQYPEGDFNLMFMKYNLSVYLLMCGLVVILVFGLCNDSKNHEK